MTLCHPSDHTTSLIPSVWWSWRLGWRSCLPIFVVPFLTKEAILLKRRNSPSECVILLDAESYLQRKEVDVTTFRNPITGIITLIIVIIITTRPKPAYGRHGVAGSWVQDQIKRESFGVFSMSHFAPQALSWDINKPGTIQNQPEIMKNHEKPTWNLERPQQLP